MLSGFIAVGAIVLLIAFLVFVVWAANSRWAGEHDWFYNRHNPRKRVGGSLGLLETIYQPSMEYVIEERASEGARGSAEESGDPPETDDPPEDED